MNDAVLPEPAAAPPPEVPDEEDMPLPSDPKTVYLAGLFLLATFTALYVAQAVVLPIVIALVLKMLLQPIVRLLERIRVPRALGAVVSILVLIAILGGIGTILSGPATRMVQDFPSLVEKVQQRFESAQPLLDEAKPLLEGVGLSGDNPLESLRGSLGGFAGSIASGASGFASHLLETLLLLFYLLVFGEVFMLRLVEILPRLGEKKQAVEITQTLERDIGAYLLTITIINAVVGCACGAVMWAFGVPGAVVWGVVAFCLNFVPILGPFIGVALFAVVGLATLGAAWAALLPAVAYLAIHFAEGELITPMLLAKRFTLNPIGIMVSLIFWYWLWGVQGAVLSVPLLAIAKIVSDRLRPLRAMGHLMEG